MNTFDLALVSAAIDSLMVYVLALVPDGLIAALTPLYKVAGNDPATNNGPFVGADLTVNGLKGDGATKFLDTGVVPSVVWPLNGATDPGLTAYKVTAANGANVEIGGIVGGHNDYLQVDDAGGNSNFATHGAIVGTDLVQAANNLFTGFVSGQRGSLARADIFTANSVTPFSSIGHTTVAVGAHGTQNNVNLFGFALNNGGGANFNAQRLSYLSAETALSAAQDQAYFNAIQALRVSLGGGFV